MITPYFPKEKRPMDHKKSSWEDTAAKLRAAVQDREPGGGDHYLRPQRNQHF